MHVCATCDARMDECISCVHSKVRLCVAGWSVLYLCQVLMIVMNGKRCDGSDASVHARVRRGQVNWNMPGCAHVCGQWMCGWRHYEARL